MTEIWSNMEKKKRPKIAPIKCNLVSWNGPQEYQNHRINMELDLQSLFGLHVHSCTHGLRPRNLPPPHIWAYIRGRYWSAKRDDISLWPPATNAKMTFQRKGLAKLKSTVQHCWRKSRMTRNGFKIRKIYKKYILSWGSVLNCSCTVLYYTKISVSYFLKFVRWLSCVDLQVGCTKATGTRDYRGTISILVLKWSYPSNSTVVSSCS